MQTCEATVMYRFLVILESFCLDLGVEHGLLTGLGDLISLRGRIRNSG